MADLREDVRANQEQVEAALVRARQFVPIDRGTIEPMSTLTDCLDERDFAEAIAVLEAVGHTLHLGLPFWEAVSDATAAHHGTGALLPPDDSR
jgi:hypothetical protein